ncbi:DNA alkylation repair protein [Nonomuraea harbinensis]|uniref:DNA alkylation repair protein n=1 Tax=Nonomuraea harbinensis TaxID=1286938 RepID=A0ABW1C8J3_9ACTN|nr:DNA alkylation repair protein [Nonomuraea harbinensis]
MTTHPTSEVFTERLTALPVPEERRTRTSEQGVTLGIRMRDVFDLAEEFMDMPPDEISKLLDSEVHEVRVGACSIMDKQARRKRTPASHRTQLYDLYLGRHDRINTWDLVDLAAPYVVGGHLYDKPRDTLYTLARSAHWWERRTAIVATYYFIRHDDLDDTFGIAEILADDPVELVQKAYGGWIREAGKREPTRLLAFLDRHSATMPRTALRYAVEHLDGDLRAHYMGAAKRSPRSS